MIAGSGLGMVAVDRDTARAPNGHLAAHELGVHALAGGAEAISLVTMPALAVGQLCHRAVDGLAFGDPGRARPGQSTVDVDAASESV